MSKIVKSVAVVDNRPSSRKTFADQIEENLDKTPVIKREIFSYRENPYSDQTLVLPDRQGYLNELNRLKIEISQAKDELRRLGYELDEGRFEKKKETEAPAAEYRQDDFHDYAQDAQEEAQRLLMETKRNIDIMTQASAEEGRRLAEEAKNNGYLEGFDQGFSQAMDEFKSVHGPQAKELENLLEQISNFHDEQVAVNERDLTSLAITVAQKIIGQEIKADPRAVTGMLFQTLDANRREESVRITVSPDLMPVEAKVSAEVKKLISQIAPGAIIRVDEDTEPGTCVVETGKGITDLSVDTQLDNIKMMLTED